MISKNGLGLAFLLVSVGVLLVVAPANVRAECDCDKPDTGDRSGVSKFFHNVGCGIKSGAKTVAESVKDGYTYVKTKITPGEKTQSPSEEITPAVTSSPVVKLQPLPEEINTPSPEEDRDNYVSKIDTRMSN